MFAELAEFQKAMGRVQASLRNPQDKARLGELLGQLEKARAEAEEKVPPILQEKLENARKQKADMEEMARRIDQMKADLKARQAEAEKKKLEAEAEKEQLPQKDQPQLAAKPGIKLPSLPEVPINLKLGEDLRTELLKTYGGLTKS
jgi:hypothetical protein